MEKRVYYPWIDWAKFWGIYLVIIGHGWLLDESAKVFVYSFHMPFFFMISGLLFKYKTMPEILRNDWKRLIVPYLLINIFFLIRSILIGCIDGSLSAEYIISRVGAIALGCGYPNHGLMPVCDPSWFIISLFFMRVILTAIRKMPIYANWIIIFVAVCAAVLLKRNNIDFLTSFNSALLAFPFFYLGVRIQPCLGRIKGETAIYLSKRLLLSILFAIITYKISIINGRVDVDLCCWGNHILLFYIAGLTGSMSLLLLSSLFTKANKITQVISKGTIFILGFNLYLIYICERISTLLPNYQHNNLLGLVWGGVIMVVCYFLILFLKRYFPMILGNRK